jgi:hypothetical protein
VGRPPRAHRPAGERRPARRIPHGTSRWTLT